MKTYNYFVENLDTEKITIIQEKIAQLPLVKEATVKQGQTRHALSYVLGDNDDEYSVFVSIAELLQQEGADIAFADEKEREDVVDEQVILQEVTQRNQDQNREDNSESEQVVTPRKKGFFNRVPDFTARLSEIAVALILFAFVDFSNYLLAGVCLILVSYEIFYDTVCDLSKKKISDNLFASIVVVLSALCGHVKGSFLFAVIFSLLKVLTALVLYILKKKTEKHYSVKEFQTEEGEKIQVEDLKTGIMLSVSGNIYFSCQIQNGEAEIKKENGEVVAVKEGDILNEGDVILNKRYLTVKCLENYSDTSFKQKREAEELITEQINAEKPTKKQKIIYIAVILAGLIYCFISPLFYGGEYISNLSSQGIKGVLLIALFAPLTENWSTLRKELFRYTVNKQITLKEFDKATALSDIKTVLYAQDVFVCGEELHPEGYGVIREVKDLGVLTQTAFSEDKNSLDDTCNQLKLKNRTVATKEEITSLNPNALLIEKNENIILASVNQTLVFSANAENLRALPKTYSASKRKKLLKKLGFIFGGIISSVLFILTCLSVLNFSSAIILSLTLIGLVGVSNLFELVEM